MRRIWLLILILAVLVVVALFPLPAGAEPGGLERPPTKTPTPTWAPKTPTPVPATPAPTPTPGPPPAPDLALEVSFSPGATVPGDKIGIEVQVTNRGNLAAHDVEVQVIPDGLDLETGGAQGPAPETKARMDRGSLVATLGTLHPGQEAVITGTAKVDAAPRPGVGVVASWDGTETKDEFFALPLAYRLPETGARTSRPSTWGMLALVGVLLVLSLIFLAFKGKDNDPGFRW